MASLLVRGRPRLPSLLLLVLFAVLPAGPARATILLFDQARDAATGSIVVPTSSGGALPADYGDNVTSAAMSVTGGVFTYGNGGEGFTPDVTVDIFSSSATPTSARVGLWNTGYGDLVNVVFGEGPGIGGSPFVDIVLTAAQGFVVDLYGFELAAFGTDLTIAGIDVLAGALSLYSEPDVLVQGDQTGPRHNTFDFGAPLSAPEVRVRLDLSNLAANIQDNVAIDSIRFGQTPPRVPEPGTGVLALCGLAFAASARSSRRPSRR